MPFDEKLKSEVRRKTAFRCCRCQAIGVEIHHIFPEAEGGPDTIDNAAPLCSKCHSDFGGKPLKRKEIREMRDWWYDKVKEQYSKTNPRFIFLENKLDRLLTILSDQTPPLEEIKTTIREYIDIILDGVNKENAQRVVSRIVNIEKPPFIVGSPCQMAGQPCPSNSCQDGVMDVDETETGVKCNKCGLYIPAVYP